MLLYKYLSTNSYSFKGILKNQELYYAPPHKLNDPFEIMRNYTVPSKTQIKKYLNIIGGHPRDSKEMVPIILDDLKKNKALFTSKLDTTAKSYGILCMTPHWNNILMWAHYGDSHKGVCIGFDIDVGENDKFGECHHVIYSDRYPEVSMLEIHSTLKHMIDDVEPLDSCTDMDERMFCTKSNHWSYENEIRFIGKPGLHKFSGSRVREIVLGANISDEDEQLVIKYKNENFKNATIVKLGIAHEKYELEIYSQS